MSFCRIPGTGMTSGWQAKGGDTAGQTSSASLIGKAVSRVYPLSLTCLLWLSANVFGAEPQDFDKSWAIPRSLCRQTLFLPPAERLEKLPATASDDELAAHARIVESRRQNAKQLLATAKEELAAQHGAAACQLLYEALREDPHHAEVRRVLGYTLSPKKLWQNGPPLGSPATSSVDHPKFRWAKRKYWRLETAHYRITTDHSPQAATDLGGRLEDLQALWRQIMFDYWSTATALEARLQGGKEPLEVKGKKLEVVLFKDREEYLAQLSSGEPKIGLTTGLYLAKQQTAFFYAEDPLAKDPSLIATWQHEATHQLLQEIHSLSQQPGEQQNFWLVEGIALYFESLARHAGPGGDYWTLGGPESHRLQLARYRALSGDFYLPLEKLVTLSREELQQHPDIRKIYAQAAGLTHFLMDGEGGKYRPATMMYLRAIYDGKDRADTLSKLTGRTYAELDQSYRQFLQVDDKCLENLPSPAKLAELSLGRTKVTAAAAKSIAACQNLTWLDLTSLPIGDAELVQFGEMPKLQRLFLEGTQVTAKSLPKLSQWTTLTELDLSSLSLTDESLAQLAALKQLKSLYLTNTRVTDAVLPHLTVLTQLESLDVSGTPITQAALDKWREGMPRLKSVTGGK